MVNLKITTVKVFQMVLFILINNEIIILTVAN